MADADEELPDRFEVEQARMAVARREAQTRSTATDADPSRRQLFVAGSSASSAPESDAVLWAARSS
jgi:hypothetical protein